MKSWRSKWFYVGNMHQPLEVHSDAAPIPNVLWDQEVISTIEIEGIRPYLN
jgi:hypothetical protein